MEKFRLEYSVGVTKTARKQGEKLGVSKKILDWLIAQMKQLKFWPANAEMFEYERVSESYEFKFNGIEDKWIRIFVYQDDVRRFMWVIKVLAKKTNKLSRADFIGLETAESMIKQEIKNYEKEQKRNEKLGGLKLLPGGKDEK